tara:strand:- start:2355 stop:2795 length:441 start_codon:yes stop_codon:yes gene_type:complete
MSKDAVSKVREFEDWMLQMPQSPVATHHIIHAGMYSRTIMIPKDTLLTGALIEIATILIINGDAEVGIGEDTTRLTGYAVLPASQHRKQSFYTHEDTHVTMVFATDAKTVEDAEIEFTKEAVRLMSRAPHSDNHVVITGEEKCQEQ